MGDYTRLKPADGFGLPFGPQEDRYGHLSAWHIALMVPSMTPERLHEIDTAL